MRGARFHAGSTRPFPRFHEPILVLLTAIAGASIPSLTARAAGVDPARFPERTVLETADLHDDPGRVIGAVGGGKVLRVLADRLGPDETWAEIAVDQPAVMRARVQRERLAVFLREAFPVEPSRT